MFAKRPLRVEELSEGVGILQARDPSSLSTRDLPREKILLNLFAPPNRATHRLTFASRIAFPPPPASYTCHNLNTLDYSQVLVLLYTAKYWDKHLDDIDDAATCDNLRSRITSFIRSANFRTRMDGRSYLRRVFPSWFVDDEGRALWEDYRRFLHDWKYFLSCQECAGDSNHRCKVLLCVGDLTRCWWSALGTSNFLAKFEERFRSFSFQSEGLRNTSLGRRQRGAKRVLDRSAEAISNEIPKELNCDYWSFDSSEAPALRSRYTIHLPDNHDWKIYNNPPDDQKLSREMAPFVAFSNDFQTLRIGTQLYARRGENSFDAIQGAKATSTKRHPAYVEEFARRDNIVILASRFMLNNRILEPFQDAEKIADTEDSEDESDSDPEDDYEWSETSSVHSGSDEEQDWHSSSDSDSDKSADAAYSLHEASNSESDEVYDEDEDVDDAPSDLESLDVETEAIVGRAEDEEEEYACDLEGDVEGESGDQKVFSHAWRTKFRKSRFHHTWASITIVDTTGTNPKELFNFSRPITFKMYDSPPVIHPFHPLAVWPVGCDDVLFVDFERESHFVRRLRPSTYGSRQVFMRCRFSSCGKYLHIVTLEARQASFWDYRHADRTPIKLAIVVLTFSLSSQKPSRAPPQLIHRVRVHVGTTSNLQATKLPFTFTWRGDQVYVTCSSTVLRVYRVQLFGCKPSAKAISKPGSNGGLVKLQEPVLRPKMTWVGGGFAPTTWKASRRPEIREPCQDGLRNSIHPTIATLNRIFIRQTSNSYMFFHAW
ncbi:hypothetical protein CCMSSC00406_0010186 [Pleurotus cornucopiae]|uniref:Uncharacterized protein n=1 Tax=Pleurotus cornucopiae TaxID=5321 RepID=A0ACB7IQ28_PLECO|nr:hypothetical protein CCMSSC00406_0010186 [Pleurotus cornucopiae]